MIANEHEFADRPPPTKEDYERLDKALDKIFGVRRRVVELRRDPEEPGQYSDLAPVKRQYVTVHVPKSLQ